MTALQGRERKTKWTLTPLEQCALDALRAERSGLTDRELGVALGVSFTSAGRVRLQLKRKGLVRTHSKKEIDRLRAYTCPRCGEPIKVVVGRMFVEVWRPSGEGLREDSDANPV